MRGSGYVENVIVEVCAALGILAKYGILGVGVNNPNAAAQAAAAASVNCINLSSLDQANANTAGSNVLGALSQINIDSLCTVSPTPGTSIDGLDIFRHHSAAAAAAAAVSAVQPNQTMALNNNNLTLPTNTTMQTVGNLNKSIMPSDLASKEKNVEIPEVIVGAILGNTTHTIAILISFIYHFRQKIILFHHFTPPLSSLNSANFRRQN